MLKIVQIVGATYFFICKIEPREVFEFVAQKGSLELTGVQMCSPRFKKSGLPWAQSFFRAKICHGKFLNL